MEPHHSLFREKALQEYRRRQERDILPHSITPSILILLYLLLLLLLVLAGVFIWLGDVSLFTSGSLLRLPAKI
jgi:hypothetical protein